MRCGLPRPLRRCRGRMEGIYVTGDFSAVVAPEQDRAPDSVSLGALCVPGATPLRATGPISPRGPAVGGRQPCIGRRGVQDSVTAIDDPGHIHNSLATAKSLTLTCQTTKARVQ
jgi:hypothetical protein